MSDPWIQILDLVRRVMGTGPALGTLVYDEQIYPIVQVLLEGGLLKFVAVVRHPVRLPRSGMIRIHGADGRLIVSTDSAVPEDQDLEPEAGTLVSFQLEAVDRDWPQPIGEG